MMFEFHDILIPNPLAKEPIQLLISEVLSLTPLQLRPIVVLYRPFFSVQRQSSAHIVKGQQPGEPKTACQEEEKKMLRLQP